MGANAFRNSFDSASTMTLPWRSCRAARPVGTDGDGVADLEAIEAGDRKPRHNEPMLADDLDH
jgi:hypothetical protein